MSDEWTVHHKGEVEGRKVTVQTYSEGGYRVSTTQAEDHEGYSTSDGTSTLLMPPSAKGTPIDIDADTLDEMQSELSREGFSDEAVAEIIGYFPA